MNFTNYYDFENFTLVDGYGFLKRTVSVRTLSEPVFSWLIPPEPDGIWYILKTLYNNGNIQKAIRYVTKNAIYELGGQPNIEDGDYTANVFADKNLRPIIIAQEYSRPAAAKWWQAKRPYSTKPLGYPKWFGVRNYAYSDAYIIDRDGDTIETIWIHGTPLKGDYHSQTPEILKIEFNGRRYNPYAKKMIYQKGVGIVQDQLLFYITGRGKVKGLWAGEDEKKVTFVRR